MRPQKPHVARAENAKRKNARRKITVHQRLVVQFLAADRLDAQQLRARRSRAFEKLKHRLPIPSAAHQRRAFELAVVVRRHAQHALQAAAGLGLIHSIQEDVHDFQPPFRMLGHRWQRLEFNDHARRVSSAARPSAPSMISL